MFKSISKFINSHPIGQLFNLDDKNVAWKKVGELKPGMRIAVPLSVLGSQLSDSGQSVISQSVSEADKPKTGKLVTENGQPKTDNRDLDIAWDEIVSIRKVSRERVWDIEVEGTHNFVAGHYVNSLTGQALTPEEEKLVSAWKLTRQSFLREFGEENQGQQKDYQGQGNADIDVITQLGQVDHRFSKMSSIFTANSTQTVPRNKEIVNTIGSRYVNGKSINAVAALDSIDEAIFNWLDRIIKEKNINVSVEEAIEVVKQYENGEIVYGGIVAHNTTGILMRAGASTLGLSSGTTSTTADIQLAAADKISLFGSSFSLTTSSGTAGDLKLDSAGTLTISTSRNNTNIALMPGTGGVALGISTPASSATLDLSTTSKGFLPPRMTTAQRDAIGSPTKGLVIFNDTTAQLNVYSGSSWQPVGTGGGSCNSSNDCIVVLTPEYPNAIISADGTNNIGTVTSDLTISASNYYYNYYEFSSGQASLQDYDVYISWQLPSGWADWDDAQNAISVDLSTEDASSANNKVDVTVYRQSDADSYAETANVSPTGGEWRTTLESKSVLDITKTNLNTIATWAAGDVMVMKLKLYSKDNYYARIGNIRIIYENQ